MAGTGLISFSWWDIPWLLVVIAWPATAIVMLYCLLALCCWMRPEISSRWLRTTMAVWGLVLSATLVWLWQTTDSWGSPFVERLLHGIGFAGFAYALTVFAMGIASLLKRKGAQPWNQSIAIGQIVLALGWIGWSAVRV